MKASTVLSLGVALFCCIVISQAQNPGCKCNTLFDGKCDAAGGQPCSCTIQIGPDVKEANCNKYNGGYIARILTDGRSFQLWECTYNENGLESCGCRTPGFQGPATTKSCSHTMIPKCFLMKKESLGTKAGRRVKPQNALIDNDGLYNPDCEADGTFKAKQCNGTQSCWCVNTAGVRRTEKGDKESKTCAELVRTFWVIVQMKRNNTDTVTNEQVAVALRSLITTRYNLSDKYIKNIEFEDTYIFVDLMQNSTEKGKDDVDIIDVGYYMEKDIKGDSLMSPDNKFQILINGKDFSVQEPLIMYIDDKPHELSMKRLTAGVIAVIVVVVVAIIAGIVVLIVTRRKRGKYEKAEMKEMNEMQRELNS